MGIKHIRGIFSTCLCFLLLLHPTHATVSETITVVSNDEPHIKMQCIANRVEKQTLYDAAYICDEMVRGDYHSACEFQILSSNDESVSLSLLLPGTYIIGT